MVFIFFFFFFSNEEIRYYIKFLAVYCSSITNEGNAKWNKTLANGQTVSGSCIYGYYGSISRTCTQSGSNGNWDSITGSCLGILISFFDFSNIFWIKFITITSHKLSIYFKWRECRMGWNISNWTNSKWELFEWI